MDIGSIFLILALLTVVVLFISRPLLERRSAAGQMNQAGQQLSALLAERDRVINALQELDFDFTLGKVPAEDYPVQRNVLLQQGAEVLQQIDTIAPSPSPKEATTKTTDDRLETAIAARRSALTPEQPSRERSIAAEDADDTLEAAIAARRRARQEKSAGFCPRCGKPVLKSDRFCPKCGKTLSTRDDS